MRRVGDIGLAGLAGLACLAGLSLAACGGDELAPSISQLRYVAQVPQKPLMLRFELTFADSDGDLGLGTLHLTLDGEERSELAMDQLFGTQMPPLAQDVKQGNLEVEVELDPPIGDGREIEVGMWLVDRRGAESNRPSVTLRASEVTSALRTSQFLARGRSCARGTT